MEENDSAALRLLTLPTGGGKTEAALAHIAVGRVRRVLLVGVNSYSDAQALGADSNFDLELRLLDELNTYSSCCARPADFSPIDARSRFRMAADRLRTAESAADRRSAARDFLWALAELIVCLLRFMVRALFALLSRLLGREVADEAPTWKPDPIDTAPQIAPRGPNSAFPVTTHRGGHCRSTLGSVVLAV